MMGRVAKIQLAALLLGGVLVGPAAAQQSSTDDLKKEIESLKQTLGAIQKDIQDIKAMLSRQAPPPSGLNVVLDLASNPVKGERTARLTLVEFSDYQ